MAIDHDNAERIQKRIEQLMDRVYISRDECVASKKHLTDVDDDGFCNICGEQ